MLDMKIWIYISEVNQSSLLFQ